MKTESARSHTEYVQKSTDHVIVLPHRTCHNNFSCVVASRRNWTSNLHRRRIAGCFQPSVPL